MNRNGYGGAVNGSGVCWGVEMDMGVINGSGVCWGVQFRCAYVTTGI